MTSYTVDLSPVFVNPNTDGSLDASVLSGLSQQRSLYVEFGSTRKVYSRVIDGQVITDTAQTVTTMWANLV